MDVDSGIETMEVDDQDVKFEIKRRRVKKKFWVIFNLHYQR